MRRGTSRRPTPTLSTRRGTSTQAAAGQPAQHHNPPRLRQVQHTCRSRHVRRHRCRTISSSWRHVQPRDDIARRTGGAVRRYPAAPPHGFRQTRLTAACANIFGSSVGIDRKIPSPSGRVRTQRPIRHGRALQKSGWPFSGSVSTCLSHPDFSPRLQRCP